VIPLVLISYVRAYLGDYESHKKIVKFAYPVWLYVAVTGVIVFFMISPYYV
jgi:putative membrane protein